MENKACLITGCSGGIGKQAAIQLAKMNYNIIMLVRDSNKSRIAFDDIKSQSGNHNIKMFYADLASPESVANVSEKIKSEYAQIDILINNAGILKRKYESTADGYEMTLAVNYLAPFLLTKLLLPIVEKSPNGRIINLTSELYKKGTAIIEKSPSDNKFNGNKAYANSKMLVVLFTKELARRLENKNVTVNCVHPGVVATDSFREYPKLFSSFINLLISKPEVGAEPVVYLATSPDLQNISGKYFNKSKTAPTVSTANDEKIAEKIWQETESLFNKSLKKQV
ncbi:MAG: SDR family oxidoreductase [Calditrichaeota bacterium]|nr:SDR family oxidoreductase [Calditrichota bacterium]